MERSRAAPLTQEDTGFTLIELLVVMVIIGILASIAIPVYLNQRARAADTQAKSDLRQLAQNEEVFLVDHASYDTIAAIQGAGLALKVSHGVTLTVVFYDTDKGYCLTAKSAMSPTTWWFDSQAGGLQPRGSGSCPATTSGAYGGQVVGA